MTRGAISPPCPPLTISVEIPAGGGETDWLAIPATAGVMALEDDRGRTLLLATTGDLRRAARSRLAPAEDANRRGRGFVDFRQLARTIKACTVGSCFEADWAFLQHARLRTPTICRIAAERWRAWFVHIDPAAEHPRLTKTCVLEGPGVFLGPIVDKHAAQKAIETLQGMFDLCRYHHILVQAPNATACAYKEMGRCPAPCDGSVSMEHYHGQISAAVEFARIGGVNWRQTQDELIAAARQDNDSAGLAALERRLEDAQPLLKSAFANFGLLDQFRYIAVLTSEQPGVARLMLLDGGWIEPLADVEGPPSKPSVLELIELVRDRMRRPFTMQTSEAWMDNLHLAGWHLLRPRPKSISESFIRIDRLDATTLSRAIRKAASTLQIAPVDEQDVEPIIEE